LFADAPIQGIDRERALNSNQSVFF
jgi:hypothetical protein